MATLDVVVLVGYFLTVTLFGFFSGRSTKTTHDFFFAGQRYGWFVIAMSCVATVVGSYSFVKYSGIAYDHGIAGSQNYLNDWMWIAFFVGGWLPILWLSGIWSIPEYFEKRFGSKVRAVVTVLLLIYMVGYIGINFRTLGKVLDTLQPLGADPYMSEIYWSVIVAVLCAFYVTAGGQVSVIATDLFQGVLLLLAGFAVVWLGVEALSEHGGFWANLPQAQKAAFTPFNEPPNFSSIGLFWQDGMANTTAFYFVNQGLVMRFLSAKNMEEGRKAIVAVVLILMPLAAIAVCGGGWVARAIFEAGLFTPEQLKSITDGDKIFVVVTKKLTSPGFFGLIMAALTAALMSTADTLINATAAVTVNDVWKPYIAKNREDSYYLKVARWASIATAMLGILLVPVFMGFDNIFHAHGMFTAAITPPLVVALLMSLIWKRYTTAGVLATLIGGMAIILLSMVIPEMIAPFSHGVEPGGEGAKAYKYMRAFFGLFCCVGVGVIVSYISKAPPESELTNLVVGHLEWPPKKD
ncbi:MAG TPA: sodium:solute symporter family protein [Myxococcales bacterium]|nr:sodium:solute symporter family protein [Myxococcales bacterium]HIN85348.1 sodium:solute symporter family protein [Myxococcales bacterium]